jgi:hypothetical protein
MDKTIFLEAQRYDVEKNIVYQDNKNAILLETNGKKSSGKRTCALNIRYFFITDQVEKGNTQIEHWGTNNMVRDFFRSLEHCGTNNMVGDVFTSLCKAKSSKDFGTISSDVNEMHRDTCRTKRDVT